MQERNTDKRNANVKHLNDFLKKAGPLMKQSIVLLESLNWTAVILKDATGRIVFVNSHYIHISNRKSPDEVVGLRSDELPNGDLASVYSNRERMAFESGIPYMNRADQHQTPNSRNALNFVAIMPLIGIDGSFIGTCTCLYCDRETIATATRFDPIKDSLLYINEHLTEDLSVPGLAKLSGCSESKYRKLFTELTLFTPSEYITRKRVNLAKEILATSDAKISSIAVETGFYDQSHFIRTFKAITNTTPTAYRRKRKQRTKA